MTLLGGQGFSNALRSAAALLIAGIAAVLLEIWRWATGRELV
jgi:hypothetical protein